MDWRLAESLSKLRSQLDTKFPRRDRTSDGTIGDTSHSARKSDHNPNEAGDVCALDVDRDIAQGFTARDLAEILRRSRDRRIKYLISDRRIVSSKNAWTWRPYDGANAHREHMHISVGPGRALYDSVTPWPITGGVSTAPAPAPKVPTTILPTGAPIKARRSTLQLGSAGADVGYLQRMLGIKDDNDFGPQTLRAVKAFQKKAGLAQDGIAGAATWLAMEAP